MRCRSHPSSEPWLLTLVCDLSWVVERSDQLVSHHVRILRAAGLVISRREGKMVMYALAGCGRELVEVLVGSEAVSA